MIGIQGDFLITREGEAGPLFREKIPDTRTADEREADRVVERVFGWQRATYGPQHDQEDSPTLLARIFYTEDYVEPRVTLGGPNGVDVSPEEFVQEVILKEDGPRRNCVDFLLGEIGVGKTAFVNWLISQRLQESVESGKLWFSRVDLEDLNSGKPVSPQQLVYYILYKISLLQETHPELLANCEKEAQAARDVIDVDGGIDYEKNFAQRCRALCSVVNAVQRRNGRRFVLIIDNIDFVCHLNDRGLYVRSNDTGDMHVLLQICEMIELFNHQRQLGGMGTNVLIITRFDSYEVLGAAMTASYEKPPLTGNGTAYVLHSAGWEVALGARIQLLSSALQQGRFPDGKRGVLEHIPKLIEKDLAFGDSSLVEHLGGITNDGLRQMMTFFAQYGWVGMGGATDDVPRLIHQVPVGLLTFMLGTMRRFSEARSKFPNIYLCNKLIPPEEGAAYEEFPHTYWLKYLLLALIASEDSVELPMLLDVFTDGGKGYDEGLVRQCLGNLTDPACGHCVRVNRAIHPVDSDTPSLSIASIQATKRGAHCLKSIFHRFFYLQLVVEEPSLPIPRLLRDEFSYSRSSNLDLDYSYVVRDYDTYMDKAVEMVKIKAEQVLLFMCVLERALIWEKRIRGGSRFWTGGQRS